MGMDMCVLEGYLKTNKKPLLISYEIRVSKVKDVMLQTHLNCRD